jgi:hypothetical protein
MYYLKIGISIIFVIGFFASLIYLFWLSIKVGTRLLDRKEAMRKSFITSFFAWMALFFVAILWQEDISSWDFRKWVMASILIFGFSFFTASLSALGLWNWKK